jgi:hypothetical protein
MLPCAAHLTFPNMVRDYALADLSNADVRETRLAWPLLEGALITPQQLSLTNVGQDSL